MPTARRLLHSEAMPLLNWLFRIALLVLVVSLVYLAWAWVECLFGTSDDGLHCVPAVFATVAAGPLTVASAAAAWLLGRRMEARKT